jgi:hypothetical protein
MKTEPPIEDIRRLLGEYTDLELRVGGEQEAGSRGRWDAVFEGSGATFLVEFKRAANVESIGAALRQIEKWSPHASRLIPLIVVPFMGDVGKDLCRQAGVAWLDLSGNACITAPRLRIAIEGKPNRYLRRGRPSDSFAPKASRVTRTLLLHPGQHFSQTDLAGATGLGKGFVSRIVNRLVTADLIERDDSGFIHVPAPGKLLSAWRAGYDFLRHEIVRAVIAARSGPDALTRVTEGLRPTGIRFAATGLSAAWAYAPFASYRLATVYLDRRPDEEVLKQVGARETASGANFWFVLPRDAGVFDGSREVDGVPCVSPLQTYLDLKGQPERADEAADELRRIHLPWADA